MGRPRVLLVFAAASILCGVSCKRGGGGTATSTPAAATPVPGATRSVLLFYADPMGDGLVARRGSVAAASDPGTLATATLALLLRGPAAIASPVPGAAAAASPAPGASPALLPIAAIPDGVELRALFLDGKGTAVVDLGHLAEKLPGGTESEVLALWSIVDTLAFNFPADARRVRILVDGHQVDTVGHVALDAPLSPRRDLVSGELPPIAGAIATPVPADTAETPLSPE